MSHKTDTITIDQYGSDRKLTLREDLYRYCVQCGSKGYLWVEVDGGFRGHEVNICMDCMSFFTLYKFDPAACDGEPLVRKIKEASRTVDRNVEILLDIELDKVRGALREAMMQVLRSGLGGR